MPVRADDNYVLNFIEPKGKQQQQQQQQQHDIVSSSICSRYSRASVSCYQEWFHGKLTRVEAEQALAASDCDCFLLRESEGGLVLSLIHRGQVHHVALKYGLGWYELEGGSAQHKFTELVDLVSYYHENTISESLQITLGQSCHAYTGELCISIRKTA